MCFFFVGVFGVQRTCTFTEGYWNTRGGRLYCTCWCCLWSTARWVASGEGRETLQETLPLTFSTLVRRGVMLLRSVLRSPPPYWNVKVLKKVNEWGTTTMTTMMNEKEGMKEGEKKVNHFKAEKKWQPWNKKLLYAVVCACAAKLYCCNEEHNFHVILKVYQVLLMFRRREPRSSWTSSSLD